MDQPQKELATDNTDQFDREARRATFFWIPDSVLHVPHVVDHSIESRVRVTADVRAGVELSDLIVESCADRDVA